MESTDQYNFSIFSPRNLHGKKNRNVIFTMLVIWAVAVFGFQVLLRIIQKPTPEKSLIAFEASWPRVVAGNADQSDQISLLNSLVLVRGKSTVKPAEQEIISGAISHLLFKIVSDSSRAEISMALNGLSLLKVKPEPDNDVEFLELRKQISARYKSIAEITGKYTGFSSSSLEASILARSLGMKYPESLSGNELATLPGIMKLYLTHNQSVLTDSVFLGFPFHYFYTAFFLLVLFVALCIIYNVLIGWRLRKEGIVE